MPHFFTSLLRNLAEIDTVMDALCHRDPTNVMKYLLLDDERNKSCALSLANVGIPIKGSSMKIVGYRYQSCFSAYIQQFLQEKREAGFIYESEE